jgi:hypothetical protein
MPFSYAACFHIVTIQNWIFSNAHNFVKNLVWYSFYIRYSISHFEALEQTLCLRLVSRPVDKKFFLFSRNSLSRTVCVPAVPRPYRRTRACAAAAPSPPRARAAVRGVLERTPHARRVHVRNGAAPAVLRTGGDPRAPFPGPRDLERGGSVTAPPVRQRPHEQRHSSRARSRLTRLSRPPRREALPSDMF